MIEMTLQCHFNHMSPPYAPTERNPFIFNRRQGCQNTDVMSGCSVMAVKNESLCHVPLCQVAASCQVAAQLQSVQDNTG